MHRYATGWEFAASTDAYLIRTFDLFAASAAKGQDVQLMTSGMAAIVDEMHGRALSEESRRRREAEQGSSKRFQVLSVPYYFTKPRVVDGRYTRSEKITTTSGNDFSVSTPTVSIEANGWITVREVRLAGNASPLPVTWFDAEVSKVVDDDRADAIAVPGEHLEFLDGGLVHGAP